MTTKPCYTVCIVLYCIIVLQNYGLLRQGKHSCINFSVPEVKILIILSCYGIFVVLSLVNTSVTLYEANPFLDDLLRYFACQLGGLNPMCEDIRREFEKHLKPGLNGATYFSLGFFSWLYLLFAIQGQDIKRLSQGIASCYNAIAKFLPWKFHSASDKSIKSSDNPVTP